MQTEHLSGNSSSLDRDRHAAFASLVAHWFWELDSDLRYVYHEGPCKPLIADKHSDLLGKHRLEMLSESVPPSEELEKHHELMRAGQSVDMTVPLASDHGTVVHVRVVAQPMLDKEGNFAGYYGCARDVTDRVAMREQLAHLALRDELTGIYNRREFQSRLKKLKNFVQDTDHEFALCLIDLDRFKLVNDAAGHAAGDKLLQELAQIFQEFLLPCETLARLGGDEFGLLMESTAAEAKSRTQEIIDAVSEHQFTWEGQQYFVGACVGITPIENDCGSVRELIDRADSACYAAKSNGRNQSVVFALDSAEYLQHRKEVAQVEIIKCALRANRLRLFMQPIVPAKQPDNRSHYEILLRLESESGELVQPATFIPVAERFLIMQDLDLWVLKNCLETIKLYEKAGREISLSINLSGNTLSDASSLESIIQTVRASDVDGARICFEITETTAISNIDNVVVFMNTLKEFGVRFALDDFGAGLSSFGYIRSMPIDYLKIDGYFIRNIRSDETNRAITQAFIQLSRSLKIKTVAECVEDKATRNYVADMGIDFVQGYGISRPVGIEVELAVRNASDLVIELPKVSGGN